MCYNKYIKRRKELIKWKQKIYPPRQVCELFFKLFNEYGIHNTEEVFKNAKQMYFELEERKR